MENAQDLKKAVQKLKPALTGTSTLPVLSCVRFQKDRMWATDLQGLISIKETFTDITDVAVPKSTLDKVLQTMEKDDSVKLVERKKELDIVTDDGTTRVKTLSVDDYPAFPFENEKPAATMKLAGSFMQTFRDVAVAASPDESRQVLTTVCMDITGKNVQLAATDSYRLFIDEIEAITGVRWKTAARALLPTSYFSVFNTDDEITVELYADKIEVTKSEHDPDMNEGRGGYVQKKTGEKQYRITFALFHQGDVTVGVRPIEGDFPTYLNLIPDDNKNDTVLHFHLDSVLKKMKRFVKLMPMTSKQAQLPVILEIVDGKRSVAASLDVPDVVKHTADFNLIQDVKVHLEKQEPRFAFNPTFFRDALVFAGSTMRLVDPLKPAKFQEKGSTRIALQMPVRLS